ncbi:MAG: hypothetical protein H7A34_01745 [bacterium]|nr:hypothetical protein [bacterium]
MITKITIENFKGISNPITIPLRPITLFLVNNSSGKVLFCKCFAHGNVKPYTNVDIDKVNRRRCNNILAVFRNLVA